MCNKGLLKRVLPFFATFALGIFIASFFVGFGPRFGSHDRRVRHFQEMQRLNMENDELREENLRLKSNRRANDQMDLNDNGSSVDTQRQLREPPPPPPAPRSRR